MASAERVVRTPWTAPQMAATLLGFVSAWAFLHILAQTGFYGGGPYEPNVEIYREWASQIFGGAMPYRDFPFVYPPLSLPAFLLPGFVSDGARNYDLYQLGFELEMLACGLALAWCVIDICRSLAVPKRRLRAVAVALLLTPPVVGPLLMDRYDLWPAALTAAAIAALLRGHRRVAFALLALGIGAKVYPVVLAPVFLVYIWRQSGRRAAITASIVGVTTGLAILVPFLVVARAGTVTAIRIIFDRPPQIESLGAALLFVRHALFGGPLRLGSSFGSKNLLEPLADRLALAQSVVLVISLVALWTWHARRKGDADPGRTTVTVAAASVALYVALGKVLSDQYVIWLIPLVLIVPGRRGTVAVAIFALAAAMTAAFYPGMYVLYSTAPDLPVSLFALARALVLLALAIVLAVDISALWQRWRPLSRRVRRPDRRPQPVPGEP